MQVRFSEDERFPPWKITFLQYVVAASFVAFLIGYWWLQIGQYQALLLQAEHNRIRSLPIIAPRGRILDRNGQVLVGNFPAFTILLNREDPSLLDKAHLEKIVAGLPGDAPEPRDVSPPELLSFFSFRRPPWRKLRTTNVIERCFVEVRRRNRPMVCFVNVSSVDRIIDAIFNGMNEKS